MIDVQNVSMRFNLGIEKNNSLKQMAVDLFSKSAREKRKMHKKENEFWALQDVLKWKKVRWLDLSDQMEQGNLHF